MRQALLLVAVFAVAFGVTLLFVRDAWLPIDVGSGVAGTDGGGEGGDAMARQRQADVERTMVRRIDAAGEPKVEDVGAAAAPETGEVEGEVKTDDGLHPANVRIAIAPRDDAVRVFEGGRFRIEGLKPGRYMIAASADGYLLRRAAEVDVAAGRRYSAEVWLDKGFQIAGVVVEDTDQRPIQGALIDFNGMAQAVSDARGTFRTGYTSPRALDVITLSHEEYDRTRVIHAPMPDAERVTLAMSRGKGTVTGRVAWPSGMAAPASMRVRVWRFVMEGHEELRRERVFSDTSAFEIRGVFDGANVLEVSFPGTTIAARRIEFDLKRAPALHLDVDLRDGGVIDGAYTSTSGLVASQPVTLLDAGNHAMGEARTDAAGRFRFDAVAAGSYVLRFDAGIPQIYTPAFSVEAFKTATVTVDGATGRLR